MRSSQDGAEVPGEKGARGAWASLAQTEEEDRSLHLFALKPTDGCSRCGAALPFSTHSLLCLQAVSPGVFCSPSRCLAPPRDAGGARHAVPCPLHLASAPRRGARPCGG